MKYTEEQVKNKFESLPKDVKDSISSIDTTNKIIDIGDKYGILVDQMGELVDETGLVMLGFTKSSDFVKNVRDRLNISRDMAQSVVKDINDQIFIKIRDSLRKIDLEKISVEDKKIIGAEHLQKKQEKKLTDEVLNKDQLMKEIENPTEDISDVNKIQSKPKVDKILPKLDSLPLQVKDKILSKLGEEKMLPKIDNYKKLPKPEENKIIEKKLTEVTKTPIIEEKKILEDKGINKQKEKPIIDLYREPID